MRSALVAIVLAACSAIGLADESAPRNRVERDQFGAIVRGDVTEKRLALVFTGDEFGESTAPILDALKKRGEKASLFVTGRFLRTEAFKPLIARIIAEGHYLGPHSDGHLLYCDWDRREKSLVSKKEFTDDLRKNRAGLRAAGALADKSRQYFVPPYEWYNAEQVRWSRELGITLINFTPGSGSNRDYAREDDKHFVPSQKILEDILTYEQKAPNGLNGFLLLLHLGSGRKDPFHSKFGQMCDELAKLGYRFQRVDELLTATPADSQ
jgi:peptidoglycan/xylan/chitin deacetylase (PgdA/CDA1 family)